MANIKGISGLDTKRILSAKFYLFKYISPHPRSVGTNLYYNMYPLVFTLGKINSNLFQGIDFHYISVKQRIILLNNLRQITPSLKTSPARFSSIFKQLMVSVRKYRPALAAFRKYNISSIVGGKMIRIAPGDWDEVIQIPIEKFFSGDARVSPKKVQRDMLVRQKM